MDALQAMRRYVYGFVNGHDFDVCRELMSEDYLLHMGNDRVAGRDENYIPAVRHQMDQFPTLAFAIHDMITDGRWTALLFSEHGASATPPGGKASWLGVGVYRFDGERLAECWVEQDHHARRQQLACGKCDPVPPVAVDPWADAHVDPRPETGQVVETWLAGLPSWPPEQGSWDPGPHSAEQHRLELTSAGIDVLVSCGDRAAFHATLTGRYDGGLRDQAGDGQIVSAHIAAFATVHAGSVVDITGVTNRVAVARQLRAGQ